MLLDDWMESGALDGASRYADDRPTRWRERRKCPGMGKVRRIMVDGKPANNSILPLSDITVCYIRQRLAATHGSHEVGADSREGKCQDARSTSLDTRSSSSSVACCVLVAGRCELIAINNCECRPGWVMRRVV